MNRARALILTAAVVTASAVAFAPTVFGEAAPATTQAAGGVIRIKAGSDKPVTDKAGNVWLADAGFIGGEVIERPTIAISGTDSPQLFQSERYDMTAFGRAVPNGKYTVKLYLAETYEGVTAVGERVFTINVEGQELKDFDPFKEAGGANKAIVKSFDVEVADGKLDITFAATQQASQINAIEIVPTP